MVEGVLVLVLVSMREEGMAMVTETAMAAGLGRLGDHPVGEDKSRGSISNNLKRLPLR